MSQALLRPFLILSIAALSACHLYVEDKGESPPEQCLGPGCAPNFSWPDAGPPEDDDDWDWEGDADAGVFSCTSSIECGPGCFCNPAGRCEEIIAEPDAGIVVCSDLDETSCAADEECTTIYRGIDCTAKDGSPCTEATADCSCESFAYDRCEEVAVD